MTGIEYVRYSHSEPTTEELQARLLEEWRADLAATRLYVNHKLRLEP